MFEVGVLTPRPPNSEVRTSLKSEPMKNTQKLINKLKSGLKRVFGRPNQRGRSISSERKPERLLQHHKKNNKIYYQPIKLIKIVME